MAIVGWSSHQINSKGNFIIYLPCQNRWKLRQDPKEKGKSLPQDKLQPPLIVNLKNIYWAIQYISPHNHRSNDKLNWSHIIRWWSYDEPPEPPIACDMQFWLYFHICTSFDLHLITDAAHVRVDSEGQCSWESDSSETGLDADDWELQQRKEEEDARSEGNSLKARGLTELRVSILFSLRDHSDVSQSGVTGVLHLLGNLTNM